MLFHLWRKNVSEYYIMPFQFKHISNKEVILVNDNGDFIFIEQDAFEKFIRHQLNEEDPNFLNLKSHIFIAQDELEVSLQKSAARYRTRKSFLRNFTTLHMMVITLRCNQKCDYCQVSCAEEYAHAYDMNIETARNIIDMILSAPSEKLKIEFQGGEPLLNWKVIEETVIYAEKQAEKAYKKVEFVLCTNLTIITREQLQFCRDHKVAVSTSLDGPKDIHDAFRKSRSGVGTYDLFMEKLALARDVVGDDGVDALMTTSSLSLGRLREVIDEYMRLGMKGIFIRALNPYGFAAGQAKKLGYETERFVEEYLKAIDYILQINKKTFFPEHFAALLFSRILTPFATGFVDLQSPSGAGISGVIYDYDGSVFPSDEARMLARMNDRHFCLGNVMRDSYNDIFLGNKIKNITEKSCVETTAPCAWCVYQTFCGTDPVRNYLESGSLVRNMSGTNFCVKNKGIFDGLFKLLRLADQKTQDIIWSWITHNPKLAVSHD